MKAQKLGRDNKTPQSRAVELSSDVHALRDQVARMEEKMAQHDVRLDGNDESLRRFAIYEKMVQAGACAAKRNILEAAQHGIFRAAEATRWNSTTQQMERIPYSDACKNWNAYLDDLKPEEVGRVRGLGFSSEVVRETRKGAGLTYSLLSEAVHCFDRDMAKGAMKALQLDGQPLWDLLYSLACKEADAKEDDAREHRQYLFSLWPARANDGESRQSSVERW